jgi:hypothetical protein
MSRAAKHGRSGGTARRLTLPACPLSRKSDSRPKRLSVGGGHGTWAVLGRASAGAVSALAQAGTSA